MNIYLYDQRVETVRQLGLGSEALVDAETWGHSASVLALPSGVAPSGPRGPLQLLPRAGVAPLPRAPTGRQANNLERSGATAGATRPGAREAGQRYQPKAKRDKWAGPGAGGGVHSTGQRGFPALRAPSGEPGEDSPPHYTASAERARCSRYGSSLRL